MINLRFPFEGSETVKKSYAQAGQDLFVLTALNGKRKGIYLEIGAAWPQFNSNTYLLEKEFGWSGLSIESDKKFVNMFNSSDRVNKCIGVDATKLNFASVTDIRTFDYLSIDCEPPNITYEALLNVFHDNFEFAVITYEHDSYNGGAPYKKLSREFLISKGYKLIASNISVVFKGKEVDFEDWWVLPKLVDRNIIDKIKSSPSHPQNWKNYLFN